MASTSSGRGGSPGGTRGRRRARRASFLAAGALLGVVLLLALRVSSAPPREPAAAPPSDAPEREAAGARQARLAAALSAWSRPAAAPEPRPPDERRLARAVTTLETYAEATRYPPGSRPMRENPDHDRPHWVPKVTYRLAHADGRVGDARVTIRQDRRYLAGDESATLSLLCANAEGPQPCEIQGAWARTLGSPLFTDAVGGGVPVPFTLGSDGWTSATFQPAAQGFAGRFGLIRIGVALRIGDEEGATGFQLEYTPRAPARFTRTVTESLEHGSLVLRVGTDVYVPGRYVVTARVDDADGNTFALLTFNDVLAAGRQAVPLVLFGKLMRDEHPAQPCRLRDVEGFLLLEDTMPDREMMASAEGVVHVMDVHPESELSDAEWQSEERSRHLAKYAEEVERATRGGD